MLGWNGRALASVALVLMMLTILLAPLDHRTTERSPDSLSPDSASAVRQVNATISLIEHQPFPRAFLTLEDIESGEWNLTWNYAANETHLANGSSSITFDAFGSGWLYLPVLPALVDLQMELLFERADVDDVRTTAELRLEPAIGQDITRCLPDETCSVEVWLATPLEGEFLLEFDLSRGDERWQRNGTNASRFAVSYAYNETSPMVHLAVNLTIDGEEQTLVNTSHYTSLPPSLYKDQIRVPGMTLAGSIAADDEGEVFSYGSLLEFVQPNTTASLADGTSEVRIRSEVTDANGSSVLAVENLTDWWRAFDELMALPCGSYEFTYQWLADEEIIASRSFDTDLQPMAAYHVYASYVSTGWRADRLLLVPIVVGWLCDPVDLTIVADGPAGALSAGADLGGGAVRLLNYSIEAAFEGTLRLELNGSEAAALAIDVAPGVPPFTVELVPPPDARSSALVVIDADGAELGGWRRVTLNTTISDEHGTVLDERRGVLADDIRNLLDARIAGDYHLHWRVMLEPANGDDEDPWEELQNGSASFSAPSSLIVRAHDRCDRCSTDEAPIAFSRPSWGDAYSTTLVLEGRPLLGDGPPTWSRSIEWTDDDDWFEPELDLPEGQWSVTVAALVDGVEQSNSSLDVLVSDDRDVVPAVRTEVNASQASDGIVRWTTTVATAGGQDAFEVRQRLIHWSGASVAAGVTQRVEIERGASSLIEGTTSVAGGEWTLQTQVLNHKGEVISTQHQTVHVEGTPYLLTMDGVIDVILPIVLIVLLAGVGFLSRNRPRITRIRVWQATYPEQMAKHVQWDEVMNLDGTPKADATTDEDRVNGADDEPDSDPDTADRSQANADDGDPATAAATDDDPEVPDPWKTW